MSEKKQESTGVGGRLAEMLGLKPQQANMLKMVAIAVAIGILFLNAGDLFGLTSTDDTPPANATPVAGVGDVSEEDALTRLEKGLAARLEQQLSRIDGAGKVEVMVRLASGPSAVPVLDTRTEETTTDEKGAGGDTRTTTTVSKDVTNVTTANAIAVLRTSGAEIAGVSIIAEGAWKDRVKAALYEAAKTTLNIPGHKIFVEAAKR